LELLSCQSLRDKAKKQGIVPLTGKVVINLFDDLIEEEKPVVFMEPEIIPALKKSRKKNSKVS